MLAQNISFAWFIFLAFPLVHSAHTLGSGQTHQFSQEEKEIIVNYCLKKHLITSFSKEIPQYVLDDIASGELDLFKQTHQDSHCNLKRKDSSFERIKYRYKKRKHKHNKPHNLNKRNINLNPPKKKKKTSQSTTTTFHHFTPWLLWIAALVWLSGVVCSLYIAINRLYHLFFPSKKVKMKKEQKSFLQGGKDVRKK